MEAQNNITEQMKEAARNAESKPFAGMDDVWDKISAKLDADEEPQKEPVIVPFFNYKKMIAAAAVLILIGFGTGYVVFNDKHNTNPVAIVKTESQASGAIADVPKGNAETIPVQIHTENSLAAIPKRSSKPQRANVLREEGVGPTGDDDEIVQPLTQSRLTVAKGKLRDDHNEPVTGATIKVTGTSVGTMTDVEGNFEVLVPANSDRKLSIVYPGLKDTLVAVSGNMSITMVQASDVSEDVVVTTPYGRSMITTEKYIGVPAPSLTKKIENIPVSDIAGALEGAAPGVQVTNGSGAPGSGASIQIRGRGSLSASTSPLIVLNGAPYDGDLSSIDPKDIDSMTILKDAQSTSLYGSRGSNGMIVIVTKNAPKAVEHEKKKHKVDSISVRDSTKIKEGEKPLTGQPAYNGNITIIARCGGIQTSLDPSLIVLDGAPYDGELSSINPSKIATITVSRDTLKNMAIYGVRGKNGVTIITTKHAAAKNKKFKLKHLFTKPNTNVDSIQH